VQSPTARVVLRLTIEYLTITLPILIYVGSEAVHSASASLLLRSPEWSIATIFLAFQTLRVFIEGSNGRDGRLLTVMLLIPAVLLVFAAGTNVYMGLEVGVESQSWGLLITRWGLLVVATVLFVCFAGSAIWSEEIDKVSRGHD
jgi:hypothetical protein